MDYATLERDEFDAVVTGELTHYALWLEGGLDSLLCDYFLGETPRRADFLRLLLQREGLSFQDKLGIVRAMLPLFGEHAESVDLPDLLKRVDEFRMLRNALAHGRDVSEPGAGFQISIEVISRSGKEKIITITPESHAEKMRKLEELLEAVQNARKHLREKCGRG
ncbi:MAG: hypothetical protein A2Y78_01235 [Acidobacteria bacterium RBG_13_68_16]|nr:MAG: hypothetical protein A2Y78_01235 [Acidobacteria bacterium RBG_13_68_16]